LGQGSQYNPMILSPCSHMLGAGEKLQTIEGDLHLARRDSEGVSETWVLPKFRTSKLTRLAREVREILWGTLESQWKWDPVWDHSSRALRFKFWRLEEEGIGAVEASF